MRSGCPPDVARGDLYLPFLDRALDDLEGRGQVRIRVFRPLAVRSLCEAASGAGGCLDWISC